MRSLGCLILACVLVWWVSVHTHTLRNHLMAPIHLVQGVTAGIELYNLKKTLIHHYTLNRTVLPEDRFEVYLNQEFRGKIKEPTLDPWRTPYRYQSDDRGFVLWSAGPDRRFGTEDDLKTKWTKEY